MKSESTSQQAKDDSINDSPKKDYPIELEGREFATTCPHCLNDGWVSLGMQDTWYNPHSNSVTITNGWDCLRCNASWYQSIDVELGPAISNRVRVLDKKVES